MKNPLVPGLVAADPVHEGIRQGRRRCILTHALPRKGQAFYAQSPGPEAIGSFAAFPLLYGYHGERERVCGWCTERRPRREGETMREDLAREIDHLHSYYGSRPIVDFNKCGQAAVATVLDHYGLDPYGLERPVYDANDGRYHWRDGQIIDQIKHRFPPDNFFGLFGTTGAQIANALAYAGLETRVTYSADADTGGEIWEEVKRWANEGFPVVVIMDRGKLGGPPFVAHWGVVYKVAASRVHLANTKGMPVVSETRFLRAFRCRFMPDQFNHCAVFSR